MSENPRIEELRRRVQKDPASIAFAQLAEEYRRSGHFDEAVRVCRTGLAKHPSYLSARVTLARALIELEQYGDAQTELDYVLRSAPENLAAIRGLAEIHQRRGELGEALKQYQTALGIAKHDPELEESVHELTRQLGPGHTPSAPPVPRVSVASPPPIPDAVPAAASDQTSGAVDIPMVDELPPTIGAFVAPPAPRGPALSPELEAAADEFTRALEALDAVTLDLPAPPLVAEPLQVADLKPAEDDRVVPAQDWEREGFDAAWTNRSEGPAAQTTAASPAAVPAPAPPAEAAPLDLDLAPPAVPEPDAEGLQELESWLNNIVSDRTEPTKRS